MSNSAAAFSEAEATTPALAEGSPLVLDISSGGAGVNLAAHDDDGVVYWDLNGDGFREQVNGWIASGTGYLAIDLDENGVIDNNNELFGNDGTYTNGFDKLAQYDSNSDDVIDASDDDFDKLLVWTDDNGDGFTDDGELHTLASLNITEIDLGYTVVGYSINGNAIYQESSFTMNGNSRDILDVWYGFNEPNTVYDGDYELDLRALFLPTLRGYGWIPDLHIAMSQNEDLLDMVTDFATMSKEDLLDTAFDLKAAIEEIIFEWAGVSDVDPNTRDSQITTPGFDARKMAFVEKLVGSYFSDSPTVNPYDYQGIELMTIYHHALGFLATRLLAQTEVGDLFGNPLYNPVVDTLTGGLVDSNTAIHFSKAGHADTMPTYTDWSDIYFFRPGDAAISLGGDVINDTYYRDDAHDMIWLSGGVEASDVKMWVRYDNFVVIEYSGSDQVLVVSTADMNGANEIGDYIQKIIFDDGTVWDLTQGLRLKWDDSLGYNVYATAFDDHITGSTGVDSILGMAGDDVIEGRTGADILSGDTGEDTYVFTEGDSDITGGGDWVYEYTVESGIDKIVLHDVLPQDVRVWMDGANLKIMYSEDDLITVYAENNYLTGETDAGQRVEQIVFDDTSVWDFSDGLTLYLPDDIYISYVSGSADNDTIYGSNQNNIVYGYGGNDALYGGSGAESFSGGAGDDVVGGGGGADTLYGDGGADTFIFEAASALGASDWIMDFSLTDNDKIDISDVISGYDPLLHALTDFVKIEDDVWNSVLSVDVDGTGGTHGWVQIATLAGITGLTDEAALVTSGNLIVG